MSRPTILIVDDNNINRILLKHSFANEEYNIVEAGSGMETLEKLTKHDVDLILLDIMMPLMDGYETCAKIKMNPRSYDIPIIFITALNDKESKIKGLKAGAVDFISKPFDTFEVQLRVKQHLKIRNLYTTLRRQNERVRKDLLIARQVQMNLLPENEINLNNNYLFNFEYVPCDSLGGDFLDIKKINEDEYLFYLADISGHGVPSALVTIFVKQFFDVHVEKSNLVPGEIISNLNEMMLKTNFNDRYLTIFVGIINTKKNVLKWSSAGPNTPPFLFSDNTNVSILQNKSMAVGRMEGLSWDSFETSFPENGMLFLYSDAATEIKDEEMKQLGIEGFKRLIIDSNFKTHNDYEEVIHRLLDYSGEISFNDDLTFLAIKMMKE